MAGKQENKGGAACLPALKKVMWSNPESN